MLATTVLLVTSVALVVLLAAVVYRHFVPLLRNPGAPRGSFGWPLIGETIGFLRPHASNTTGDFLRTHIARYGGAVFKSHLFGFPTVVSCDEELNHFVLQNEERLFQCSYPGSIRGILGGSSLLVVTGDRHRLIRGMALAFVASTGMRPAYLADVDRDARTVVASWRGRCAVAFCDEAKQFAFGAIVEQVLGLSPEEPLIRKLLEHYSTFMKGLVALPLNIPGTPYARAVEARRKISVTLEEIMEERWKGDGSTFRKSAFLDVLIANSELSHDDKVTFVLDSLLAGYETTSTLLSMLVYFIGQSPQCMEQLKIEHESIRSSKGTGEFLNAEDYKKMEYTQRVINETLRCGNIVKFLHRRALKHVKYKEYVIPAGWKVLPILGSVHLDPALYKNPQEFDPSRWEGLNQQASPGKKFAPFGGGVRLCPGSELGKVEAAFFLHHLVLQYSWRLDGKDVPMAHPYVEFRKGLPIEIWCHQQQPDSESDTTTIPWFVGQQQ